MERGAPAMVCLVVLVDFKIDSLPFILFLFKPVLVSKYAQIFGGFSLSSPFGGKGGW